MEAGVVNSPEGVKKQVIVPWVRADSAFPIAMEAVELAGAIRQVAREMESEDKNPFTKYYKPVIIGSFGIAALIFLGRWSAFILTKG
jgi:hypothetical protein